MAQIYVEFIDSDELPEGIEKLINAISHFYHTQSINLVYTSFIKNKYINDTCSICLEKFKKYDLVCDLPCKHTFHKNCIKTWAKQKTNCPLCKRTLINKRKIRFTVEMLI